MLEGVDFFDLMAERDRYREALEMVRASNRLDFARAFAEAALAAPQGPRGGSDG